MSYFTHVLTLYRLFYQFISTQISKIAYAQGMVISMCQHCKNKHLIADNEKKMDFPDDYGLKVEEYLSKRGERVQKLTISQKNLENYYLVDHNGEIVLVPKAANPNEVSCRGNCDRPNLTHASFVALDT